MNKTNYFIECLELMGWVNVERDTYSKNFLGSWLALEPGCTNYNQTRIANNDEELINFTIQELIKRDGVMGRIYKKLGRRQSCCLHGCPDSNYCLSNHEDKDYILVKEAIELGITHKELMGVEG